MLNLSSSQFGCVLLSAVGGFLLCVAAPHRLSSEESAPYQPEKHPAQTERHITAFTRPAAKLIISAEDSAKLLSLPYQVGMSVGQDSSDDEQLAVIGTLDSSLSEAQQQSAQAQVREATSNISRIKADIARNDREIRWWESELARFSALAQEGRASQRQVDETTFRLDQVRLSGQGIEQQLLSAEAALIAAQANATQRQIIVDRHTLRAPKGWIITKRHMEPLALASPGQAVIELADLRQLEIELRLSSQETAWIESAHTTNGLSVEIDGQSIPASLHAVSPDFDAESRKHVVLLRIDGDQLKIARGGLVVRLRITLPDPTGGFLIPLAYAKSDLDQWLVYTTDNEYIEIKPIRLEGEALVVAPKSLPKGLRIQIPPSPAVDEVTTNDEATLP